MWIGLAFSEFFGGASVFGVIMQTLPIDEDEVKKIEFTRKKFFFKL